MRLHRRLPILWLLPILLAGCSSTLGSKFGGTPQSRSIAVVGERPLPASTGEPGGKVVAEDEEPEPRRNPKTRISGRVFDEVGDPVAGATVRLADGGVKGGKEIRGTTDRSGGFTLNGLRPGSNYVLIAEGEDENGPILGRIEAKTAETGVEISLVSESKATTRRSARPARAKPVSNREDAVNDADRDASPRLNREDVSAPSSGDPDSIDPGPPEPSPSRLPKLSSPQPTAGWRNGKTATASRPKEVDPSDDATASDASPRRTRPAQAEPAEDEDGTNPLPPAIDRKSGVEGDPEVAAPVSARSSGPRKVGARAKASPAEAGEIALAPEASLTPMADRPLEMARGTPDASLAGDLAPVSSLLPEPGFLPSEAIDSAR